MKKRIYVMNILVTGSLAFDFIMDFPGKFSDHILPEKIHAINLSFLVKTMKKQYGGTAGNIAYNLALLGMKPTILATAGKDFADYKKFLERSGVDASMIRIIEAEPTASAFIFTDMADNQITGFYPGAMTYSNRLSLKPITGSHPVELVVIAPNEPLAMIKYTKECQELGIDYMFDPGMQLPRLSDKDLALGISGAKIVIGNDYEVSLIMKRICPCHPRFISESNTTALHSAVVKERMPKQVQHDDRRDQIWITTLGEKGAEIKVLDTRYPARKVTLGVAGGQILDTISIPPAVPRVVLDPTGAGDAFRAGFLAGYLRGLPLDVCGKMGSVCAVYTVEKYGTTTHKFSKKEFLQRYKENFGCGLMI